MTLMIQPHCQTIRGNIRLPVTPEQFWSEGPTSVELMISIEFGDEFLRALNEIPQPRYIEKFWLAVRAPETLLPEVRSRYELWVNERRTAVNAPWNTIASCD